MNRIKSIIQCLQRDYGLTHIGLLMMVMTGLTTTAMAKDRPLLLAELEAREVHKLKESGDIMSLESLLKMVRRDYPGRVIEVELEDEDGRYVYEMEIVDEAGSVWEIHLDADTGELLERERDD